MHIRKSETTPRGLLFLFASIELFSAFASIGLSALAARGNILSIPLDYFLVFLDRALIGGWTMVALWRANRAGIWRGFRIIGMFILEFSVKDLIGNTAEYLMKETYSFGGCLLKGVATTLIHTTLSWLSFGSHGTCFSRAAVLPTPIPGCSASAGTRSRKQSCC